MFVLFSPFINLLLLVTPPTLANSNPDIPLESEDKDHVDIIVTMKESNSRVLTKFSGRSFPTREERLNSVAHEAIKFASKTQENLLQFLSTEGQSRAGTGKVEPEVTSLWITNQVIIKNADMALIKELSSRPDVANIELDRGLKIEEPIELDPEAEGDSPDGEDGPWGIAAMNVPLVWEKGIRGEGVVVANIDTGVRGTHEALNSNFLGEGGWLDLHTGSLIPVDDRSHGTGTMSSMVGTTRNMGVAPAAKWMACRMVLGDRANDSRTTVGEYWKGQARCAQWLVCPGAGQTDISDPEAGMNCGQVPHIISHSWGRANGEGDHMDKVLLYYTAAGIIPLFSAGNWKTECGNVHYPSIYPDVISVGAIHKNLSVWIASGRGPSTRDPQLIKPDLVAPGVLVRSAGIESDTSYESTTGTSFSAPYVGGIVALMLSKNPNLSFKQVKEIIHASTVPTVGTGEYCGEKPDDVFPNFIAGYGLIDANKAIEYMDTVNMNKE